MSIENLNNAVATSFHMIFPKSKIFTYYIQSVNFPAVSLGNIDFAYRNNRVSLPDNTIIYDQLTCSFIVDEYFDNYMYIYNWMQECRAAKQIVKFNDLLDDVVLYRFSTNKIKIAEITYHMAYPVSLGSIQYVSNSTDADVLLCDVTFAYQTISTKKIVR